MWDFEKSKTNTHGERMKKQIKKYYQMREKNDDGMIHRIYILPKPKKTKKGSFEELFG